jgi:Ca2+-binding RTX toxin-like protein
MGLVATPAHAAVACAVSGTTLTVTMNDPVAAETAFVYADNNGQIFVSLTENGAPIVCTGGILLISIATSITISGGAPNQDAIIQMHDSVDGDTVNWEDIDWNVSLGTATLDDDELTIDNSSPIALAAPDGLRLTAGASGIDLTTDGNLDVTLAGVEDLLVTGSAEDDEISAAGDDITGAAATQDLVVADAGADDDTLAGGAGNDDLHGGDDSDTVSGGLGDDILDGGEAGATNTDTLDYSASATGVNANLDIGVSTGEGLDTLTGVAGNNSFERLIGTSLVDTLTGDDTPNRITPSGGNDVVHGQDGEVDGTEDTTAGPFTHTAPLCDVVSYSDLDDGVTVDLEANTTEGTTAGTDTLTDIEGARGTTGDDTLVDAVDSDNCLDGREGRDSIDQGADVVDGDMDLIDGGSGIDEVDYDQRTENLDVWLGYAPAASVDAINAACSGDHTTTGECDLITPRTTENARLGSGDDSFNGSQFNNVVFPGEGQNVLIGFDQNSVPVGTATTGGIDTVNYKNRETGVVVNFAGGGPATNADSAVGFTNGVGTKKNDTLLGNNIANGLRGLGGNDTFNSGGGADFVNGGKGNDSIRGGGGDDTLKGKAGNDNLRGGGGDDDLRGGKGRDRCNGGGGADSLKGCEKRFGKRLEARARLARALAVRP